MSQLIEVQLREYRGVGLYNLNGVECKRDDYVVLEHDRGSEYGVIVSDVKKVCNKNSEGTKGKIIRKATQGDIKQVENNRTKAKEALSTCMRKITDRKLDMQLVRSEYTFDSSKIIFYFTADGRVDFRALVKDLARVFRVRIELKQIGVRDKAKIVGGYGVCGRELCCSSYLKDFHQLSIKMAKGQGLPLNPSRISGVCGRIKCCMAYEYQVYKEFSRNLPHPGEKITLPGEEEKGRVIEVNILKRLVSVDMGEGKIVKTVFPKKG